MQSRSCVLVTDCRWYMDGMNDMKADDIKKKKKSTTKIYVHLLSDTFSFS